VSRPDYFGGERSQAERCRWARTSEPCYPHHERPGRSSESPRHRRQPSLPFHLRGVNDQPRAAKPACRSDHQTASLELWCLDRYVHDTTPV